MGRPKGGKNIIRTPKEKEKIVKDLLTGKLSWTQTWKKYNISESTLSKWKYDYIEKGIDGLKSNTGKHKNPNSGLHLRKPKNKIEELELEILKKDIEIARLKKGYMVKGVGAKKEFVTTFDKNIK
jgi:transposase-like protein